MTCIHTYMDVFSRNLNMSKLVNDEERELVGETRTSTEAANFTLLSSAARNIIKMVNFSSV